jgi:hypothetical protein
MTIELNIKYTKSEYKEATLEKVKVMPNLKAHTFGPTVLFGIIYFLCSYFNTFAWWSITLLVLSGIYAVINLLILPFFAGDIAASFARNKLLPLYQFTIDETGIMRTDKDGVIQKAWTELVSIDTFGDYMFFNLVRGSMLLPLKRLDPVQAKELSGYVSAFNNNFKYAR